MTAPEPREDVRIGSADVSVSFPDERDTAVAEAKWPDPTNWPTDAEFVAMVKEVPDGFPLCEGCDGASNPDDRSELLPHHFDCPAVEAWAAVRSWHAERVRAGAAAAWNEGHRDGCDDHLCEQMGHLSRNPYRRAER